MCIGETESGRQESLAQFPANYATKEGKMPSEFTWSEEGEPHALRRKEILKKHPEIRDLFGPDIMIMPQVFAVVGFQTCMAYLMGTYDIAWGYLVVVAYCIGGFANHNLFLAVHELAHNLAFDNPLYNRLLAFVANYPTILPFAVTFQKYHMEHHRGQGEDGVDTDIPSEAEGKFFTNTFLKTIWVSCQLFFYAIRPMLVKPKPPGFWEVANLLSCLAYDLFVYYIAGSKGLWYLALSSILGGGLHPIAGHFISEHYAFEKGYETYSYYGPLNFLVYNVGFHNEHHDFPRVPGSRLSKVKKAAPEYYDNLPFHTSWSGVIWRYITDPTVGPYSRVKRQPKKKN